MRIRPCILLCTVCFRIFRVSVAYFVLEIAVLSPAPSAFNSLIIFQSLLLEFSYANQPTSIAPDSSFSNFRSARRTLHPQKLLLSPSCQFRIFRLLDHFSKPSPQVSLCKSVQAKCSNSPFSNLHSFFCTCCPQKLPLESPLH